MKFQNLVLFFAVLSFAINFFINTNWDGATWSDWGLVVLFGISVVLFIFNMITSFLLKKTN